MEVEATQPKKAGGRKPGRPPKIRKSAEKRKIEDIDEQIDKVQSARVRTPSKRAEQSEAVEKELAQERTAKKAKAMANQAQKKKENKAKALLNNVLPN